MIPPPVLTIQARLGLAHRLVARRIQLILLLLLPFLLLFLLLAILGVLARRHPHAAVVERVVLSRQVVALALLLHLLLLHLVLLLLALGAGLDVVATARGEGAGAGGQLGGHGRVLGHPVGQGVLAVLDDGLAGLVAVVGRAGLAGGDGRVVDQLEEVLAVAGDDGDLLAVLAQGIELVRVGGLDLLARDVGELGFGDEGLGLGADELLLEDDNLGGVGFFVLELGDLVRDLLLAWSECQHGGHGVWSWYPFLLLPEAHSRSRLGCTEASMFRMLFTVTRYWS
jgi:hypothetical protein